MLQAQVQLPAAASDRPCLLYDIGKCSGPCVAAIDEEGYQELVQSWARFFEGDVRELRGRLERQMDEASANQHYEAAARARDGLAALERAASSQSVVLDDHSNLDVVAIASEGSRAAVVRFRVRFGRVIGRTVQLVDRSMDEDDREILENALTEMYDEASAVPEVVVVGDAALATPLVRQYLTERRGRPVEVTVAKRGKRRRVVELAVEDARGVIGRDSLRRQADHNVRSRALQELGAALGLEQPPYRVECFDMSHLQGTNYVGSMVVFEDALPMKSDYRHFNVKEVLGNDDVGAMEEVVRRRLSHWEEHQGTTKFRRPDLIIIDGGVPQLHAAEKAARSLELGGLVEFAALAKREELLYRPGRPQPIALERGSESALPRPAHPRRGAPLRHHVPPLQARTVDGGVVARGRRGSRTGTPRATARGVRLARRAATGDPRGTRRGRLGCRATSRRGSTIIYERRRYPGPRRIGTMSEVVLVTGMSGAGRSTVAAALEDLGWFVIDNLPLELVVRVDELVAAGSARLRGRRLHRRTIGRRASPRRCSPSSAS